MTHSKEHGGSGDVGEKMDAHGEITNQKTNARLTEEDGGEESFETFLSRREAISGNYICGKAEPLLAISTTTDPATFFPPGGERLQGASAVNAANEGGANAFAPGSVGKFEVMQWGSSGGLGFWTGVHHAEVMLKGKDKPIAMQLRTTEIFRVEQGAWKLIHRHADMQGGNKQ